MTIKELITELSKYDENLPVEIQYRDSGGYYIGTDDPDITLEERYNFYTKSNEKYISL